MSDYVKVLAIIRSCKTPTQNAVAARVVENYARLQYKKFLNSPVFGGFSNAYRYVQMSQELQEENDKMLIAITSQEGCN